MKTYQVVISPEANNRMYDHFMFLARVSENAAEKLLATLTKDMQSLEYMPMRNPPYERPFLPLGKYRYLLSYTRYRIVYQVVGDTVYIDDIQDCRQRDEANLI
jgi:hypothetical protein